MAATIVAAVMALLAGCATRPESRDAGYTPVGERPATAKEYWDQRARQDRIEDQIERSRSPRP
jgi:hypothetical protein